ncbi:MAG: hypothetical protein WCJ74_02450 [bacterium]
MNREDLAEFGGGVADKYPEKPDPDVEEVPRKVQRPKNPKYSANEERILLELLQIEYEQKARRE